MTTGRRLVWSADARNDLANIYDYLEAHASRAVADRIENAARRLVEWPLTGRSRQNLGLGLRSWAVPPHVIFYRVSEPAIEIVRVIHGRRDVDAIFNPE